MLASSMTPVSLSSLLFQLRACEMVHSHLSKQREVITTAEHTLLIFTEGQGFIHSDHTFFPILVGKCYLLPPATAYQLEHEVTRPLGYYRIAFSVVHLDDKHMPVLYQQTLLPGCMELTAHPVNRLYRLADGLMAKSDCTDENKAFSQQLLFQELIGFLLQQNSSPGKRTMSTAQEVESTIDYIRQNYHENMTVGQLAELAHVPSWQYTRLFRELTGKKPLEFLTKIRVEQAKDLLIHSDASLRDIANQVGFSDEYYFNRRFRKTTGYSPRQYARLLKSKKSVRDWTGHEVEIPVQPQRIVYIGETFNDLLALQVETIAGGNLSWIDRTMYRDKLKHVQDLPFPFTPDDLMALGPDLILFASSDEDEYNQTAGIAPTLTFNSFATLGCRLHTLGDWLGKGEIAKQWLEDYDAKEAHMWQQLRTVLKPGETASVFIHDHGDRLFVMGVSGFSSALYHPYGFASGDKIQEMLAAEEGFSEIPEAALPDYAGDRLFMLLSEKPDSRLATQQLLSSELWKSLPAVQNGKVHLIEAQQWNWGAALVRENLLHVLPGLLRRSS